MFLWIRYHFESSQEATEKVCENEKKDNGVNSSVKLKTEVNKIIAEVQISWLKPELASIDTAKVE